MHGYRLTGRGKFILTFLIMLMCLAGIFNLQNTVIASDTLEYVDENSNHEQTISAVNTTELSKPKEKYDKETVNLNKTELIEKEVFLSIKVEDIKSYDKSKIAFLTFDDGPSKNVTPEILKVLDDYDIKATFFLLGSMCEKNGIILKSIADKGHSIGIHSYSHNLNELLANEESFISEINLTESTLKKQLGDEFKTRLFRFPGGSFEDYKMQYMDVLHELGYVSVDWNSLTGDTEYVNPTPDVLMNNLKITTKNKNNIVLLMHDSEAKGVTAKVLPDVIDYLISEGFEFAILK